MHQIRLDCIRRSAKQHTGKVVSAGCKTKSPHNSYVSDTNHIIKTDFLKSSQFGAFPWKVWGFFMVSGLNLQKYSKMLSDTKTIEYFGRVIQVIGLTVEANGPAVKIGEICDIYSMDGDSSIKAEVVGFKESRVLLMPFGNLGGVGPGSKVVATHSELKVPVGMNFKGRILDGLGNPIDGLGDIEASEMRSIDAKPPNPLTRKRIEEPLPLGVRAIDTLLTCGNGQRIGIFSGSGVGKSTLMGMIARNGNADVNVITLVGERGREVRDFIDRDLMEEGLAKSVLIVATSDEPALVRLKSAMLGTAIAEYYRDMGLNVMFLMDSVTRFAMAQREIGMAVGEPPVARGYTPSVLSLLPKLLERSGTSDKGSITALYTVLVDGDDMNEPIADAVRGILDGHIVLSRDLASKNHFPAIDVLQSVSRLMPEIVTKEHYDAANNVKKLMAVYRQAEDLISIGAYKSGTSLEIDQAIALNGKINELLAQSIKESCSFEESVQMLKDIGNTVNDVN